MIGHTGFLVTARRLADGTEPPLRRRRPAKGNYPEQAAPELTPGNGNTASPLRRTPLPMNRHLVRPARNLPPGAMFFLFRERFQRVFQAY